MTVLTVAPELWSTSMMPQGILERWRVAPGAIVVAGQAVAEVRIGNYLHELSAPTGGRLSIEAQRNDVVEPGSVIGRIAPLTTH